MRGWMVGAVLLWALCGRAGGETAVASRLSHTESVVQDMSAKLCRGVGNVLTGWGEIPRQMIVAGRERGWWAVLPVGIPAGAIMTVARTGTGLFETATFFIPINDTYAPLMVPAFVWQKAGREYSDL